MEKRKMIRRPAMAVLAAVLVCILSATAFAYGEEIWQTVTYHFITSGVVTTYENENGDVFVEGVVEAGEETPPFEVRDGRVWLQTQEGERDITDELSDVEPYYYEFTDADGLRHVYALGGSSPDTIGWAEFLWTGDNAMMSSVLPFMEQENGEYTVPQWLITANAEFGC